MDKKLFFMLIMLSWFFLWHTAVSEELAWWQMNEGSGAVCNDSVNSYTGTVQNAVWTTDRFEYSGNALQCDSGQWVDIPDSIKPANITLSAWIFITGYDPSAAPVFSSETGQGASGFAWRLQVRSNQHLGFEAIAPFTTTGSRSVESPGTLTTGTWYHVAGTYDGQSVNLYMDGQLVGSNTYETVVELNTDPGIPSAIGHLQNWGVQWFRGKIDDARIFSHALPADEIALLADDRPRLTGVSVQPELISLSINNLSTGITNTVLTTESLIDPIWTTASVFRAESASTNIDYAGEISTSCFYQVKVK